VSFSLIAQALWAAGFIEDVLLLVVLFARKRWRTFPTFTSWIGFYVLRTIFLFLIYRYGSSNVYSKVYWGAQLLDLAFQVAVVLEMARVVLKPTGTWVRDARRMFLLLSLTGALVAVAIAYAISPSFYNSLDFWIEKGSLFSAMLTLELFVSMMFVSSQLGLGWNSHVMRIGQGWAIWACIALMTEGALSHFGPDWHGVVIDNVRILTYQMVTIYWTVTLWLPEPKRRTLSPEMQNYLQNLHEQLQAELQSVSSTKKH
jgi:hypothetical protein